MTAGKRKQRLTAHDRELRLCQLPQCLMQFRIIGCTAGEVEERPVANIDFSILREFCQHLRLVPVFARQSPGDDMPDCRIRMAGIDHKLPESRRNPLPAQGSEQHFELFIVRSLTIAGSAKRPFRPASFFAHSSVAAIGEDLRPADAVRRTPLSRYFFPISNSCRPPRS